MFKKLRNPQLDLQAVRLQIPVKLRHKDRANNRLLDDALEECGIMHLGVLHCYQGDQVLEITYCENEFADSDEDYPYLLRHRVV